VDSVFKGISAYVEKAGLDKRDIRIVSNCGEKAGQSVFHWHVHVLSGRGFQWPPG
jgi:histidine triad (HIT) family protein